MSLADAGEPPAYVRESEMEQTDGSHVDEVLRHTRAIRSETQELFGELRDASEQFQRALDLKGRMERHPYATMAAAAGVGYVLGGGLFSRMTATAVRLGVRALLVPMLRNELMAMGEAAMGRAGGVPEYSSGSEDGEGGL